MKALYLISSILLLITNINYSQCNDNEHKILVLGDSWAFFSWSNNSYNENMKRFGLSDKTAYSTATLSVNGTKASNFFTDQARVQELTDALNNNPTIEYVHFSLGGNDILGTYNVSNTIAQNQQDYNALMVNIKSGIDIIHSINPSIKIFLAGYDYPNFEETISNFPIPNQHPFYSKWDDMGQPTATQLNTELINVTNIFIDSVAAWNNVEFISNLGLMQNTYGQATPLTVAPGGTYAAGSLTVPGGLSNYPSPTAALNFGGTDSFHLSNNGYEHFIKRHFQEYYWKAIRNADASILSNDTTLNGTISTSLATTDSLTIGSSTGVLTFNTSSLNSTQNIANASIFIKREKLIGNNLIGEDLTLEIKSGHYGANIQLELDDYNSNSDASSIACTYGTVNENNSWMRIDLPYNLLQYINKSGTTQFKLKYPNAGTNNNFTFYNNSNQQAILDISYGGFSEINSNYNSIYKVYPNPINDQVYIESTEIIDEVSIHSINGQLISQYKEVNELKLVVNTQNLIKGIYTISIKDKNGLIFVNKIIK